MKAQVFPSKWILTGLVTSFLVGCGGSSNDSSSSSSSTVAGTVTAPAGSISYFSEPDSMLVAFAKHILPQAIADITGLAAVANATVELLEVDAEGAEVSVLATTESDSSGAFSITLPEGVQYSGQLMLRVTGTGGFELRALVLDDSVDISPISEFVVDQLISSGVALNTLDEDTVDDLIEYVNNYDLDATTGLGDLLDALQSSAGTATQELITATESGTGDATDLSGDYKVLDLTFGLHDSDDGAAGSYAANTSLTELSMGLDGSDLELNVSSEASYGGYMHYGQNVAGSVYVETDEEDGLSESVDVLNYAADGTLLLAFEGETNREDDYSWVWAPGVESFQKAKNIDLFVGSTGSSAMRYTSLDSDSDGEPDALGEKRGDEFEQSFIFIAKEPSSYSVSQLSGDYGLVYMENYMAAGYQEFVTEYGTLSFDGTGALSVGALMQTWLTPDEGITMEEVPAESSTVPYGFSSEGVLTLGGEESPFAVIAEDYSFLAFSEVPLAAFDQEDGTASDLFNNLNLMVKLPSSALDLSDRTYKMALMSTALEGGYRGLERMLNSSTITLGSNQTTATLAMDFEAVELESTASQLEYEQFLEVAGTAEVDIASNGAATIAVSDGEGGEMTLVGYFSEDGSIGVFTVTFSESGEQEGRVGLMVLLEE